MLIDLVLCFFSVSDMIHRFPHLQGSIFSSKLSSINGIDGVDASSLFSIGAFHTVSYPRFLERTLSVLFSRPPLFSYSFVGGKCGSGSNHSVLHPNPIQYGYQKGVVTSQFECWGDSGVVATSPVTDTSTNVDLEDNNQSTPVFFFRNKYWLFLFSFKLVGLLLRIMTKL